MEHLHQAVAALFFVLAAWMCWIAVQIQFKDRTDLIRLGRGPLPGASKLKAKFALVVFTQGVAAAATGGAIWVLGELQPAVLVFIAVTAILNLRREFLLRCLEHQASELRQ
jgi:hypothetical protein